MNNYPDSVNPGDPDAPWNKVVDEDLPDRLQQVKKAARIIEKGEAPNWWYECSECDVELEEEYAADGGGTWQSCPVCEAAWWEGEPLAESETQGK